MSNGPETLGVEAESGIRIEDRQLLRRYVEEQDQGAFRECVQRHVDLVYSTALRRLGGDAHSAADVTQQVFTALARQAATLARGVVLPAWLYATTRHLTANLVRAEQSRRAREREAHSMNELNVPLPSAAEWERLRQILEDVIDELSEQDRSAVLLRFFARQPFGEIGAALKLKEDAARMRVDRALEKLRIALARRGVVSTASALGVTLTQHAVVAAPPGLSELAMAAAVSSAGGMAGTLAFMTVTKLQVGLAAAAIVAGTTGLIWQQNRIGELRVSTAALQAEVSRQSSENAHLLKARTEAEVQITALRTEMAALKSGVSSSVRHGGDAAPVRTTLGEAPRPSIQTIAEGRVSRLDTLVRLTPEQQVRVAEIFRKEAAALAEFAEGEERVTKGMEARHASRAEVRGVLTPEQRQKYDVSPQSLGGGLPVDPANLVTRLDQVMALTSDQRQKATAIFWDDLIDQMASVPGDQALKGFLWRDKVRDQLRAVLTPEQQAKFDETVPYRKSRTPGGTR